jgi:hypothetical protein
VPVNNESLGLVKPSDFSRIKEHGQPCFKAAAKTIATVTHFNGANALDEIPL